MTDWTRVADEGDVTEGEPFPTEIDGVEIALYRMEGDILAMGDICTHEHVRLSTGWFEDGRIECPLHQSCFEVRTGKCVPGGPAWQDVPVYAVKIKDGEIYVKASS
ncbi:non-heme iron oxygenase ferredoxin subunit [Novosphingobium lindaniclasticum]|uniref:Rieske domain-containing protein n=1 Tax=Novosphingobium lindaniclasticum LE124 TaxID=1096930 RepID=T0HDA7_9SPHN|nr:non-heme iron oxygenase ferredoxin subunit [Novosphingobium lindaniclasticum]EQB14301.1 hypothetical protein L284_12970 [Novosphingobium lindaniclasticum LE124]